MPPTRKYAIRIPLNESFARLRQRKGYSQKNIAKSIGISQSDYSNYEKGLNILDSGDLVKLFALYGSDLNHLLEKQV
jgi:transcriptional regulator with XRE-family HTH domain